MTLLSIGSLVTRPRSCCYVFLLCLFAMSFCYVCLLCLFAAPVKTSCGLIRVGIQSRTASSCRPRRGVSEGAQSIQSKIRMSMCVLPVGAGPITTGGRRSHKLEMHSVSLAHPSLPPSQIRPAREARSPRHHQGWMMMSCHLGRPS